MATAAQAEGVSGRVGLYDDRPKTCGATRVERKRAGGTDRTERHGFITQWASHTQGDELRCIAGSRRQRGTEG